MKPHYLNTQPLGRHWVGSMFGWRKKESSEETNPCPYCNTPNSLEAKECSLCYYNLDKSARDQPMAEPSSSQSDIMTTLLGDDIEDEEEEHAVEAVLSLDEVTIEIDQFDVNQTDQEFDFIKSSGPTLSEVQDYHQPEEVELDKSDAPKDNVEFDLPQFNPIEEVAEPVHTGKGGLYSADDSTENSEDFSGTVGPAEIKANMKPEIITEEEEEHPETSLASAAVNDEPVSTPDIPDFDSSEQTETIQPPIEITEEQVSTPEIPDFDEEDDSTEVQESEPSEPPTISTPDIPDFDEEDNSNEASEDETNVAQSVSTPDIPDIPESDDDVQASPAPQPSPAPKVQHGNRIWPWPAGEVWDDRQVYREVVSMLELIKTGKLTQTAQQLDNLGPHLGNNLDMLAHIGTILRYLGREEHLQWMLTMAKTLHPGDDNVSKAIAHLS